MKPQTVLTILIAFGAVLASGLVAVPPPDFVPGNLHFAAPFGPPFPKEAFMTVQETYGSELLRSAPPGLEPPSYPEKACDGTRSAACTSCTMLKVCITSASSMDSANPRKDCPAATPFCSMSVSVAGAVCQKSPDPGVPDCTPAASAFPCTGVGFYPDPTSCQVYHSCTEQGATAQDYDCPDGYKFTSKTNGCTLQANKCPSVTCPPTANTSSVYQAFPDDTTYYVLCTYDTTATPVKITPYIFSCGTGSSYDPTTDRCVFKCTKEGNFVDTANPRQYHQCYTQAGKLIYKDKVCMATQKFSTTANACV